MPLTPPGRRSPAALGVPQYSAPQAPPIPPPAAGTAAQVLIAWASAPFSASPAWTDVSAYVRFEATASMQRGRQDNISAIQAGRLTLTLDNSDGRFTTGLSSSPYAPNVKIGRRIMVRVPDERGAFTTRFDGLITELPAQWEGPQGQVNLAVIQASDVLAWLARQPPLLSWTQQEMLADNPVALWSLADSSAVTSAADQAGQGAPPLQVVSQGDGTGSAAAGSGVPLAEVQTSQVTAQQQTTQTYTFTNPGAVSVTFPAGTLVSCRVQCWAAGSAGSNGNGSTAGGDGGNGGEYAEEPALAITPGLTYTGSVGSPGVPSGGTGGNTTLTGDSVTVTAHGSGSGSANSIHFSGGSGGTHASTVGAGGGSSGGPYQAGYSGFSVAGGGAGGAVTGGGAGGAAAASSASAAGSGGTPGGGGGGGTTSGALVGGAAGGAGQSDITYIYVPAAVSTQNSALSSWQFTPSATLGARVLSGPLPQAVTASAGFTAECWADFGSFPAAAVTSVTAPGTVTWTAPPGAATADVACWAAGSAGENGTGAAGGDGGNGGEYAEEAALAITPGLTYTGSVGSPGTPGGGTGGNTTFTGDAVTVLAHGSGSGSSNSIHFSGGSGGAHISTTGAGGGSSGGPYQAGYSGFSVAGGGAGGAVTGGGAGGAAANSGTSSAGPGGTPGGGGGGGNVSGATSGGAAGGAGQMTITVQPGVSCLLTLVQPRGQYAIAAWVTSAGHLQLASTSGYGTRSPSWTTTDAGQVPAAAFHLAVSVTAGGTATLYVNGTASGTLTLPAGASYSRVTIGGAYGGWLGGWNGSAGLLGVYPATLGAGRIGVHYTAGSTGFAGASTGTQIARIASYAGMPSFWYTPPAGTSDPSYGLGLTSYYNLAGQQPLTAMQAYEQAEAGVLYVNAAGQLKFADRASRYAAGAAGSAFTLAAGQYGLDTTFKSNDQYLTTEACFATANIPGGYPVINASAENDFGSYIQNAGSPPSPQAAPFADATATAATYSADDLMDAGNWAAGPASQPVSRVPATTLDLRTLPADGFSTAAFYGCDIGSVVQLAGLPSQAPDAAGQPLAAYHVIEGINETLTDQSHDVQLYTSPLALNAAWIPGDSLLGVLGSTNTVGRSQAPAALGPPYPVPTFSAALNRTGSAGAQDWRGLTVGVQNKLTPPLLIAQQASAQTLTTAAGQAVTFDTLLADTAGGMGTTATYTIPAAFAGWWWAAAVVQAATGTANLGSLDLWFSVTLSGVNSHWHARNLPYLSTAPYCAAGISGKIGPFSAGDTIQVMTAWTGTATSLPLGTSDGGSMLTLMWEGYT